MAAVLGGLLIIGGLVHPSTAAGREATGGGGMPEAPAPGYTPRFVTETDEASPWEDCLWASGAMLLDKWTHGRIEISRERLRRASGDRAGGSSFAQFARAVSRLYGWRPQWSPDGGDRLTWAGFLDRLAGGGGAIVAGDYHDLGYPYTRWDRSYAANRSASGHALYVERYDRSRDRMWLMDPLGRSGYRGEWVEARRIKSFAWWRNGYIHAIPTPAPPAASATGWQPGQVALDGAAHRAGEAVGVSLAFEKEGPWALPALALAGAWEQIEAELPPVQLLLPGAQADDAQTPEPARMTTRTQLGDDMDLPTDDETATAAPAPGEGLITLPIQAPAAHVAGPVLYGSLPVPTEPGLWRLTPSLERADGGQVPDSWRFTPVELRVWGERGARVAPELVDGTAVPAGAALALSVTVENTGTMSWTSYPRPRRDVGEGTLSNTTELRVFWVDPAGRHTPAMTPLALLAASGQQQLFPVGLAAPAAPGSYQLRFDVGDASGSLLAPEDGTSTVSVIVAPAPVPSPVPPDR